ncbi:hypothetical protein, partial [uncultured Sphingopyxis sp.]
MSALGSSLLPIIATLAAQGAPAAGQALPPPPPPPEPPATDGAAPDAAPAAIPAPDGEALIP